MFDLNYHEPNGKIQSLDAPSFLSFFGGGRDNYQEWILHEWRNKRAALIPSSSTANTEQMNLRITIGHWINSANGNWCDFSGVRMTRKSASPPLTCSDKVPVLEVRTSLRTQSWYRLLEIRETENKEAILCCFSLCRFRLLVTFHFTGRSAWRVIVWEEAAIWHKISDTENGSTPGSAPLFPVHGVCFW